MLTPKSEGNLSLYVDKKNLESFGSSFCKSIPPSLPALPVTPNLEYNSLFSWNVSSKFLLGEKVTQASSGAFGFVTKIDPTHNRIVLNSVEGTFTTGTVVGSDSSKSFTVTSVADEKDVVHHYTDSNGLRTTISTSNTPVSNEEYERTINEDKFNIRIIEPRYIDKVVTEFNRLVRD